MQLDLNVLTFLQKTVETVHHRPINEYTYSLSQIRCSPLGSQLLLKF